MALESTQGGIGLRTTSPAPEEGLRALLGGSEGEGAGGLNPQLGFPPGDPMLQAAMPKAPPKNFSEDLSERIFSKFLGVPRLALSAGTGAALGAAVGGLPGAGVGALTAALADVVGAASGAGLAQAYPEGVNVLGRQISATTLGLGAELGVGLAVGMGGFQVLPKILPAGARGAAGLATKLTPQQIRTLQESISEFGSHMVPKGMTTEEFIGTIAPKTLDGYMNMHPEYKAFFGKLAGDPTGAELETSVLGNASTYDQLWARGGTKPDVLPDTIGAYRGPVAYRAQERISDAVRDYLKHHILKPLGTPSWMLHGEWSAEQLLVMARLTSLKDRAMVTNLGSEIRAALAPYTTEEKRFLQTFMNERQGLSKGQWSKVRGDVQQYVAAGEALPVDAIPPKPPSFDEMAQELQQMGKGHLVELLQFIRRYQDEKILPELVQRGFLNPDEAIANYFPKLRARRWVTVPQVAEVEGAQGGWFRPHSVDDIIRRSLDRSTWAFFLEPRLSEATPAALTLEDQLLTHARVYAHLVNRDDAFPIINELLAGISNPNRQKYGMELMDRFLGRKPTSEGVRSAALNLVKDYNFLRTIAGSFLTPLVNLTQRVNVLGQVSWKNWTKAMRSNVVLDAMAEDLGMLSGLAGAKTGLEEGETVLLSGIQKGVRGLNNYLGQLFFSSERKNVLHAFRAGVYEGMEKGMSPQAAVTWAQNLTDQTQFMTRIARQPFAMYTDVGSMLGQFRVFTLNQIAYFLNLSRSNPAGAAKMAAAAVALFGSDAVFPGADVKVTRHLFGQPFKVHGVMQEMGVQLAPMMSMVGFSAEDISNWAQYLPGPSLALLQDLGTAVTGRNMGRGADLEAMGTPATPDQRAGAALRVLPLGSQLNRLRRLMKDLSAGEERTALDAGEAFGLEPAKGPVRHREITQKEALSRFFGLQPPRIYDEAQIADHFRTVADKYREIESRIADLRSRGHVKEAEALSDWFLRWNPEVRMMILQASGFKGAMERQLWEPSWRSAFAAPFPVRMAAVKGLRKPGLTLPELLTGGPR